MATALTDYLALVLPWDGPDAVTPKVCSWEWRDQQGVTRLAQAAATSLPDFERLVRNRIARNVNVWVAQASFDQLKVGQTTDGFPKVSRKTDNVLRHKTFYIDLDVGKSPGYADQPQAFAALQKFSADSGFPMPTSLVSSGSGGLHAYWVVDQTMDLATWKPLAHALANACRHHNLHADHQCTVDAVRVLRPPESFNWKSGQPRPVSLHPCTLSVYTLAQLQQALSRYSGPKLVSSSGNSQSNTAGAWGAGLHAAKAPPVDLYAVADECAVMAEAIDTHGAAHQQPLWHLLALACVFDDQPRETFHDMSSGHPDYDVANVDAMLERKLDEREQRNLGWPNCGQFSLHSSACKTCPHFAKGKSPLHLSPRPQSAPPPPPPQGDLPPGYWRQTDGSIWTEVPATEKKPGYTVRLMRSVIEGRLATDDGRLIFKFDDGQGFRVAELKLSSTATKNEIIGQLAGQRLMTDPPLYGRVQEFFVAWIKKLQEIKAAQMTPQRLGWGTDNSFCYNGLAYSSAPPAPSYIPPSPLLSFYTPVGADKPWRDLAAVIAGMTNPGLDAIVAAGFAGPLVKLFGESGLLFSTYSHDSGVGKSTAVKLAAAIFGHPRRAPAALDDTANSVVTKLAEAPHFTLFWDELKTEDDFARFTTFAFRLTQGRDKARLTRDSKMKDVSDFNSLVCCASNDSLAARLTAATSTSAAGAMRIFEVEVPFSGPTMSSAIVTSMTDKLNENFGHAGILYAQYIAGNHAQITQTMQRVYAQLETSLGSRMEERFWVAIISILLSAAAIAKGLSLYDFDIQRLQDYLLNAMARVRTDRADNVTGMSTPSDVEALLQHFINFATNRHMVTTNTIWRLASKPSATAIRIVGANDRLQDVWAQLAVDDNVLRVSTTRFKQWLQSQKFSPSDTVRKIEKQFVVKKDKVTIGAGTPYIGVGLRAQCLDIYLPNASSASPSHPPSPGSHGPSAP
jgi:hypothetical protein